VIGVEKVAGPHRSWDYMTFDSVYREVVGVIAKPLTQRQRKRQEKKAKVAMPTA